MHGMASVHGMVKDSDMIHTAKDTYLTDLLDTYIHYGIPSIARPKKENNSWLAKDVGTNDMPTHNAKEMDEPYCKQSAMLEPLVTFLL
jgi:hypothetical protein